MHFTAVDTPTHKKKPTIYFTDTEISILKARAGQKSLRCMDNENKVVCRFSTPANFFLVFYMDHTISGHCLKISIDVFNICVEDWKNKASLLSLCFQEDPSAMILGNFNLCPIEVKSNISPRQYCQYIRAGFNLIYFLSVSSIHKGLTNCLNMSMEKLHIHSIRGDMSEVDASRNIGFLSKNNNDHIYVMTMRECKNRAKSDIPDNYVNIRQTMSGL
jgi:hypothetical protein